MPPPGFPLGPPPLDTPPKPSLASRVEQSYKKLSRVAASLNSASDELGQVVGLVDAALKKLNLGVSAWVRVSGCDPRPHDPTWWKREIGYGKIGNMWGIALRTRSGNSEAAEAGEGSESWLFNEAPRWMRIEAVDHLPAILEQLVKQAEEADKAIRKKTEQALEVAQVIFDLNEESDSGDSQ